jgi:hypothetical protein
MAGMKKGIGTLILLIILNQLFLLPLLASEARAETRVTITFAAGGVACGIYIFLQFAIRSSMTIERFEDGAALVSHGPEGWHIDPPTLNIIRDEHPGKLFSKDFPETLQMNLLQLRF